MRYWRPNLCLMCFGLLCAVTGCYSARKKVAQEIPRVGFQWQSNVVHQAALPEQVLTWPEALFIMESKNLKLRRGRATITNSQEDVRQVFKDLLPTLDLHGNVTKPIEDIPKLTFDDVTLNVDSILNFPGIATFNARLFAARLSLLRAIALHELTEREQTIELYKLFLAAQEAREAADDLRTDQELADRIAGVDTLAAQVLLDDISARQISLEKTRETLQDQASELLGTRERFWILRTNSLPAFSYDTQPLPLSDTNRVGHVQIRLMAIELVGAWAQLHGIKMQRWPEVSLFISGPAIYSRSGGHGTFWDANQVFATADFFWRIDTRGNISRQVRQTTREQELQKARLEQESATVIAKTLAAQKLSVSMRDELHRLEQLMPVIDQLPPPQQFSAILNTAETARSMREQERRLRRDLAELNTLFWFVDDSKWRPMPAL